MALTAGAPQSAGDKKDAKTDSKERAPLQIAQDLYGLMAAKSLSLDCLRNQHARSLIKETAKNNAAIDAWNRANDALKERVKAEQPAHEKVRGEIGTALAQIPVPKDCPADQYGRKVMALGEFELEAQGVCSVGSFVRKNSPEERFRSTYRKQLTNPLTIAATLHDWPSTGREIRFAALDKQGKEHDEYYFTVRLNKDTNRPESPFQAHIRLMLSSY